ncbi:sigma-54-dependent transcriptional regulator [Tropicibacter naphthalenivorans]|uniref:C4-dicarboxylate transport transcriptional regulatory protein DctD n=1 Tax=Tropicibacter naphthalenivorans TaxID=441103 RepID=A0A0P1GG48_9RHOB|nr:sigma-54 dependent transcriptional regulator [Tropicibacter naphthalenivorans]CUH80404.1 C4-dicarboxylate transport transcriptional regulatory protein DctD [Tropicibacter naphthalenivorans]SMC86167.1 two-component system, NtrC family, C4-dicarboxylate transport response regulator DctD [Tropicibacter naphthalenivorans]
MKRLVLLVDDDQAVREALGQTLELAEFDAITAGSFVEAKDQIGPDFEGVIVSDIRMPGRDGFHLLHYALGQDADLPVILLTGEGDIPMAVRAMTEGAFGFLEKPCSAADLIAVIERALKTRGHVLENRALKAQLETGDPAARMLFGHSAKAEALRARVRAAAQMGTEVLVNGAPGSGVSKVAEVIHLSSARAKAPFEKRAAAGLGRDELARVWEACEGGTVFLDDIGALPVDTQVALIDALDRGGAVLIGGSTSDLTGAVAEGRFSAELYYRLEVCEMRIPSLAERPEDIPVLFRHYVAQAAEQAGITPPEITPDHLAGLMAQDWPGNARSLMSAAMRFVLGMPEELSKGQGLGLAEQMAQVERSLLAAALGLHNGKAAEAAKALKLPRKTFYDKLSKYGLKPEAFRREG